MSEVKGTVTIFRPAAEELVLHVTPEVALSLLQAVENFFENFDSEFFCLGISEGNRRQKHLLNKNCLISIAYATEFDSEITSQLFKTMTNTLEELQLIALDDQMLPLGLDELTS